MGWTIETLKEHFEKILEEKDKALNAALISVKEENRKTEVAAEKRFELLNELRSGVATKDQLEALEKLVEDLKTSRDKGEGVSTSKLEGKQQSNWSIGNMVAIGLVILTIIVELILRVK